MKTWCKVVALWAVLTTLICVWFIFIPMARNVVSQNEFQRSRNLPTEERKMMIVDRMLKIEKPLHNLELQKQINKLYAELVLVDTMDISNLITYGYDCLNLATNTIGKDSLEGVQLSMISIDVANKLRLHKARTPSDLIDAAKIYTFNGIFKKEYYDTADAIYNRMIFLVENDSIKVPSFYENDKKRYLTELKETVQDLRFYNGMNKRFQLRKYFRQ